MKYLRQFEHFDFKGFSKDKIFMVLGCLPWVENGVCIGTKVETVIIRDDTPYVKKEGDDSTNVYEKINFKVKKIDLVIPKDCMVAPVNPIAKIWGDFRNNLSVTCDDMQVLQKKG